MKIGKNREECLRRHFLLSSAASRKKWRDNKRRPSFAPLTDSSRVDQKFSSHFGAFNESLFRGRKGLHRREKRGSIVVSAEQGCQMFLFSKQKSKFG
jgi:hypothetical protein